MSLVEFQNILFTIHAVQIVFQLLRHVFASLTLPFALMTAAEEKRQVVASLILLLHFAVIVLQSDSFEVYQYSKYQMQSHPENQNQILEGQNSSIFSQIIQAQTLAYARLMAPSDLLHQMVSLVSHVSFLQEKSLTEISPLVEPSSVSQNALLSEENLNIFKQRAERIEVRNLSLLKKILNLRAKACSVLYLCQRKNQVEGDFEYQLQKKEIIEVKQMIKEGVIRLKDIKMTQNNTHFQPQHSATLKKKPFEPANSEWKLILNSIETLQYESLKCRLEIEMLQQLLKKRSLK